MVVFEYFCDKCQRETLVYRKRRTTLERHLLNRKQTKCQCANCQAVFFIDPEKDLEDELD